MFINVVGIPAPQGSKKSIGNNRFIEVSKKLPAWRKAVREAAVLVMQDEEKLLGPVNLGVVFYLPRPKTISIAKRLFPTTPPDLSKLLRAVEDSLTDAGVWVDDSYVVSVSASKFYADERESGCELTITALDMQ